MYGLTQWVLGGSLFLEIAEEEFTEAVEAKRCLVEALEVEEKFDLLLTNYQEFEHELLQIALEAALRFENNWSASVGTLMTVNRRLVNTLTACRLYLDQVGHNLSSIYGSNSTAQQQMISQCRAEYDARIGYRVMETLRNYVQHRGMPVHSLSLTGSWIEATRQVRKHIQQSVVPLTSTERLEEDSRMKPAILTELRSIGKEHDLKPLLRDYVAGLGAIHASLRRSLESDLARWDTTVETLIERYRVAGGITIGLALVNRVERVSKQHEFLLDGFILRRRELTARNHQTAHYPKIVVTNY